MTIYIVTGSTGEYSDRTDWFVCGYRDKAQAEVHVTLAQEWSNEKFRDDDRRCDWDEKCPFDPNHQMQYTGTRYDVAELDVLDKVPNYEVKA